MKGSQSMSFFFWVHIGHVPFFGYKKMYSQCLISLVEHVRKEKKTEFDCFTQKKTFIFIYPCRTNCKTNTFRMKEKISMD